MVVKHFILSNKTLWFYYKLRCQVLWSVNTMVDSMVLFQRLLTSYSAEDYFNLYIHKQIKQYLNSSKSHSYRDYKHTLIYMVDRKLVVNLWFVSLFYINRKQWIYSSFWSWFSLWYETCLLHSVKLI